MGLIADIGGVVLKVSDSLAAPLVGKGGKGITQERLAKLQKEKAALDAQLKLRADIQEIEKQIAAAKLKLNSK